MPLFTILQQAQDDKCHGESVEPFPPFGKGRKWRDFSNRPLIGAFLLTGMLQMTTIYVPFLNPIFKTQPLSAYELLITLGLSSIVFLAVEAEKMMKRRKSR